MLSSNFTVCHRPVVSLRPRRTGSFCEDCGEARTVQRCRQQSPSGPEVRAGATQDAIVIPYLQPSAEAVLANEQVPVFQGLAHEAESSSQAVTQLPQEPHSQPLQKPMRSTSQTLREIAALSIPALGSTLADPVCSLVDTAAVGQVSSLQLAALSPCTAIFNLVFLVFQFVGVTITNKLASNSPYAAGISAAQAAERQQENKRLISYSLTFAVIAGIAAAGGLIGFSQQLLGVMGTSAEMMGPATSYLQWRAIAAPAVMIMNVCQGICLGQQNSVLPLAVFSGVGLLNVVLDVWLILGGPAMGCTGAAIATAAAQWIGAGYFLHHLIRKGQEGKSVEIQWMGLPTAKDLQPFIGMASVLLSRTIFSMTAYTLITGVATAQGTVVAASHQVCLQLFWFLSYFPEPLSVAAQSLIARDRHSKAATLMLTRCILGLAAGLGIIIATSCAVAFVYGAGVFTPNPVIASTMQTVAKPAFLSLLLCCFAMAMDGISIGSDDYQHLPAVNFAGLAGTAAWLQWCTMQGLGLQGIWMGMVVVFGVRLSVHLLHHLGTHAETSMVAAALGVQELLAVGLRRLPARGTALVNAA